ncbi:MAG: OmpH family outer membrane protein [Chloroherpetonaceae bacterium]|nr:OmpH family outer membrane protein [Chloroherpetonaceae bacterium]MCS7211006.1 OmpH family outer membrane protein [Chloroherpetonaceae bacterium]MDW8018907.1 OmpH family outer membrane protein [Chloroherpetonaceae bacterium]MDW8467006.1 OmpH family outer membrane protein [Chloroherpetonaceae bacterium]
MSSIKECLQHIPAAKGAVLGFGIALGFMLGVAALPPASERVGFVEVEKVIAELPEAKSIKEKLEKEQQQAMKELEKKQKDLKDAFDEYERKKTMMRAEEQKKKEEELQAQLAQYRQLEQAKSAALQQKQAELLKPVEEKIAKTIEKVAQQQGYTLVISKGGIANPVLYGDKSVNLTYKVIDAIK